MTKITIGLVDDHVLVRKSLATTINNFENCQVVLQAANGKELQDNLKSFNTPDLILLDINMPEMDGYETAKWLKCNHPEIHVLSLTMYDSDLAMIPLLQLGVRGFLNKAIEPEMLREAILTTIETGYYYEGRKLVNLLKSGKSNVSLTPVELKFLVLACSDKTYKEIALEMNVALGTLDHYREALFAKFNVKSRVGLAIYALENGVIRKKSQ